MKKVFFMLITTLLLTTNSNASQINRIINILEKTINKIEPLNLKSQLEENQGLIVIDLREPYETHLGKLTYKQVINIPRGLLEWKIGNYVKSKDKKIVLYCQIGGRGLLAARSLKELGYTNVYNLKGGYNAWEKECLPKSNSNNLYFTNEKTNIGINSIFNSKEGCKLRK